MSERQFQRQARERLEEGSSVLVVAPTGIGKTRAALNPFVSNMGRNGLLGNRLLYTLPLRALAGGIVEEFNRLSNNRGMTIHHGEEPESQIFSERAVVTTVDQYFTAFAGAPLSWASHKSHAAAGAVLTSYSVFDEVHLLSPRYGLPLLFAILKLRQRWGLLSCVMTATMPQRVVDVLTQHCGLKEVRASDQDVEERDSWRKVSLSLHGGHVGVAHAEAERNTSGARWEWTNPGPDGPCQLVEEQWSRWNSLPVDGSRRIILFVNTVDRAIKAYQGLQRSLGTEQVLLAHSRFTKEDRRRVENELTQKFGRDSEFEGILVTTQVAEAGLNISAPLVITELCPIDSLIQRAGRCQRFKPKGDQGNQERRGVVLVVKPAVTGGQKWYVPYVDRIGVRDRGKPRDLPLAEVSRCVLEDRFANGESLNWRAEVAAVNDALSDAYAAFLSGSDGVQYEAVKDTPLGRACKQVWGTAAPTEAGIPEGEDGEAG